MKTKLNKVKKKLCVFPVPIFASQAFMIYRITGIFCGCLIFAEFCGSIEIAEIKNRKIFQSRYND